MNWQAKTPSSFFENGVNGDYVTPITYTIVFSSDDTTRYDVVPSNVSVQVATYKGPTIVTPQLLRHFYWRQLQVPLILFSVDE